MAIVERAKIEDAGAINALYNELIHWGHPNSTESIKKCIGLPLHHLMVIRGASGEENEGVIFGSALLSMRLVPDHYIGWISFIDSVIIGSRWRGRGYGEKLIQHLIALARSSGCLRIELTVRPDPDRKDALNLYKKLGFEVIGADKQNYCVLELQSKKS